VSLNISGARRVQASRGERLQRRDELDGQDAMLAGAQLPTRHGGLGSGQLVEVKTGDVVTDGVLMPRVEGTRLSATTRTTAAHRDAFKGYMDAARQDGVVLSDLNAGNIMVRGDGGITVVPRTPLMETADHVRWMLARKWEYPNPTTTTGSGERAEFGWTYTTGK
jgi:hypothetical protein